MEQIKTELIPNTVMIPLFRNKSVVPKAKPEQTP